METFAGPVYDICSVTKSDLNYEFYDTATGTQLGSWIAIDSATLVITVTAVVSEYEAYGGSTINIKIKAIDQTDATNFNEAATFSL